MGNNETENLIIEEKNETVKKGNNLWISRMSIIFSIISIILLGASIYYLWTTLMWTALILGFVSDTIAIGLAIIALTKKKPNGLSIIVMILSNIILLAYISVSCIIMVILSLLHTFA